MPPLEDEVIGIEDEARGATIRPSEEHPEKPPAVRQRVDRPFRGAETLARDSPLMSQAVQWSSPLDENVCLATEQMEIQKGIVHPEQLPEHLRDLFLKGSRLKEENAVKAALRPLKPGEAVRVEKEHPDDVLPSRWLDVWKAKDNDEPNNLPKECGVPSYLHPKSRWIIQGFRDPMLLDLQKSTPGMDNSELLWVLQVCADYQWKVQVADVSAAFCQTDTKLPENTRSRRLFVRLPASGMECFPGVTIVELLNEIYDLTTGPRAWRNTFAAALKADGWKVHPMSPCVFLKFEIMAIDSEHRVHRPEDRPDLPVQEGLFGGILLLQVDDVLTAGSVLSYQQSRQLLAKRFTLGKWSDLRTAREYHGRTCRQVSPSEFAIDTHKALDKVKPLIILPVQQKEPSEADLKAFRGLVGSTLWIARCGAPQTLTATSMLASRTSQLTILDMKRANKALQHLMSTVQPMSIKGISPAQGGYLMYSDASLANLADKRTQTAMVVGTR